jgi:hypothetical protein
MMNNSAEQQEDFFDILEDLVRGGLINSDIRVQIPTNNRDAYAILLDGQYGMFRNLPHEDVFTIGPHACISLTGLFKQICALGVPVQYTKTPNSECTEGIHGTPAMMELLQKLTENDDDDEIFVTYVTLWSDAFIRSYVCQRKNSVWILTVTFPDPKGMATSKYHTYCLAVGMSDQDHRPVVEHYLRELKTMSEGIDVFCGIDGKMKKVKVGLLAYLADRPERASIQHSLLLGNWGQRANWAAYIDFKRLPYCDRCLRHNVTHLMHEDSEKDDFVQRNCGLCCGWNMRCGNNAIKKIGPPENYPTHADD